MKPKISVVVPIYGTEKYLRKCLDSIVNQTMSEIEIICVDDCSPDESYKIVKEFQEKDSRIKYIQHEENLGQGGARNTAIKASEADFIASVDSDDEMKPNMLEELWKGSNNGEFDIVYCGYEKYDFNHDLEFTVKPTAGEVIRDKNGLDIFTLMNPSFWSKLWRKNLFLKNNIFFPENIYFEDMSTTPLILTNVNRIKILDQCLYKYKNREGSDTNSFTPKHIVDYFKSFEIIWKHLHKSGLIERYRDSFQEYVKSNLFYHAKNLSNSNLSKTDKTQYLRILFFMRDGFLENISLINNNDINSLIALHTGNVSGYSFKQNAEIEKLKNKKNELKIENELLLKRIKQVEFINSEKLTFKQEFWVIVFGFISRPTLSSNQYLKLKKTPKKFFRDSRSYIAKKYAAWFNII